LRRGGNDRAAERLGAPKRRISPHLKRSKFIRNELKFGTELAFHQLLSRPQRLPPNRRAALGLGRLDRWPAADAFPGAFTST
jgi:hypothetical protein